jgi:hypothetical protein
MNVSQGFSGFDAAKIIHLVAGDDQQQVFIGSVDVCHPDLIGLRLVEESAVTDALAIGSQVHLVHPSGRWDRALIVQVAGPGPITVYLEPLPPVGSVPGRGHRRKYGRVTAQGLYGQTSMVTPRTAMRFRVQILDISVGGANLLAHRELQRGDEVHLRLPSVDSSAALDVYGRLVWSTGVCGSWMAGAQFVRLGDQDLQWLQRFVFTLRWRGGLAEPIES